MGKRNRNKSILPDKLKVKYSVHQVIGRGSTSIVRICRDKVTGEEFVVKIVKKNRNYNAMQEVNILKELDHPNIIKYVAHQDTPKYLYIVTEYFMGETLKSAYERAPISNQDAAFIMVQLMNGLSYLHSLDIAHRDIIPSNLLVQFVDNKVSALKIVDFGLAAHINGGIQIDPDLPTIWFMAPEMYDIVRNPNVDIFSAGKLLWNILVEVKACSQKGFLQFLHFIGNAIGTDLYDLCKNMTADDPLTRYSTTDVLNHAFIKEYYKSK